MDGEEKVILRKEGNIAFMTINREKAYNALNSAIMERLGEIFSDVAEDQGIMAVVITGAGQKAFVAGADVKEIRDAGDQRTELIAKGQEVFARIRNSSKAVVAAVNGFALGGGCELAMSCDIRFASENAKFGLPETRLGLMPGYGGTQLLQRLVGVGMAKYLIFSGEMISAHEAHRCGLVQRVCTSENLMEEATALARQISSNGPFAIKACKRAIHGGSVLSLDDALKLELQTYDTVARSADAEEGMAAFLEKKTPTFKGR